MMGIMKQQVWVKRTSLVAGERILDLRHFIDPDNSAGNKPQQTVSDFRQQARLEPWEGRVVSEDGDGYNKQVAYFHYQEALVEREVLGEGRAIFGGPGKLESVQDVLGRVGGYEGIAKQVALSNHQQQVTPKPEELPKYMRHTTSADGVTAAECLRRYVYNMRETPDAGQPKFIPYEMTKAQKVLAALVWEKQIHDRKAAQAAADKQTEISVVCESQYADGEEW